MDLIPGKFQGSEKFSHPIVLACAFVALVGLIGAVVIVNKPAPAQLAPATTTPIVVKEKTVVTPTEIKKSDSTNAPSGFPSNIPIETATVTESLKTEFPDRGVTQYTVTYTSTASSSDLQKKYEDFFVADSYTKKDSSGQSTSLIQLHATKNNDVLSVVIEPSQSGTSKVYVIFLDRK